MSQLSIFDFEPVTEEVAPVPVMPLPLLPDEAPTWQVGDLVEFQFGKQVKWGAIASFKQCPGFGDLALIEIQPGYPPYPYPVNLLKAYVPSDPIESVSGPGCSDRP